jgi:signal recognition particle subunit SRP68
MYNFRTLEILLFESERSWSYAMQLKEEITSQDSHKRFHSIRRMKRASEASKTLFNLCNNLPTVTRETRLEAEVLHNYKFMIDFGYVYS